MVRASTRCALAGSSPLGSYLPSTRSRDLPGRQNVLCRVYIAVMLLAAFGTNPLSAIESELFQNVPASVASLAGRVKTIHDTQLSTVPFAFVLKHGTKCSQRYIAERTGKTVVLCHAAHVQVLDGDYVKPPYKISGGFVKVIGTGVGDTDMETGDLEPLCGTPIRAFLFSRKVSLCMFELTFSLLEVSWIPNLLTSRERGQSYDPEINADRTVDRLEFLRLFIEYERHEVAFRAVFRHCDGCRRGREIPRPPYFESTDTCERQILVLGIPLEGGSGIFGGLVAGLLFELRVASTLLKEVNECRLKMPKCLLGWNAGSFVQPSVIFGLLQRREAGTGFMVADGNAVFVIGVGSHPKRPVVHVPTGSENADQFGFLFICGIESKTVSNLHTESVVYLIPTIRRQPFLRRLKATVSGLKTL